MRRRRFRIRLVGALVIALLALPAVPIMASHTANPTSVTVAGSLQSELGCPGDWQTDCAITHLISDASDDVWQGSWTVPAGSWEYKAALNDSWTENYGLHAVSNGSNIPLNLPGSRAVKFYYDHKSHWITDNVNSVIAVAPGSFQSALGCPGDWQPDCLRSWLQDPDGDGIYEFQTNALPAGSYEAKVAINESWDENYGQGGAPNGANIPFTVSSNYAPVLFRYDATTHILTIGTTSVTFTLNTIPDNPVDVDFSGDLGAFSLDDDGDPGLGNSLTLVAGTSPLSQSFSVPAGWSLGTNGCSVTGTGSADLDANSLTISLDLDDGDAAQCAITFEDTTPPLISITTPLDGGDYLLNGAYPADYACSDAGSGPGIPVGDVPVGQDIDTSTVGEHAFTVSCSDIAGNPTQTTVHYTVVYGFSWASTTLRPFPAFNQVRAGDPIYLKFSLGAFAGLDVVESGYPKMQPIPCGSTAEVAGTAPIATLSGLHYLAGPGYYQYVWRTSASWAGSCRQVIIRLADGSEQRLNFRFSAQGRH